MALIPAEVKTALKLLNSIDISLGRIATALEKQNDPNSHLDQFAKYGPRKETEDDKSRNS